MMRVVLALVVILVVALIVFVGSIYAGVYNVAATDPHARPVRWALDTALRQSVRAHAREVSVPPLADSLLVEDGARLFASHCAMCHGAPGAEPVHWASHMRPKPPRLADEVGHWTSAELFWIIKNGLKMTGMPAWGPSRVDGEIWTIVAFLNQMPSMTPERYRQISARAPSQAEENGHGGSPPEE